MSGESPYHTMTEGDMEIESSDLSMYQMDAPTLTGKPGLEVPAAHQEVVITDSGVPSPASGNQQQTTSEVLADQRVEEFMVEIPLDPEEEYSNDSSQSQPEQPVYTMLETAAQCTNWSSQLLASCEVESVDSGLGSNEGSSILSKKSSFSRLPSQDEDSTDLSSWMNLHPESWTSKEVLDWIYHLAMLENSNIDGSQLKGESFSEVDGATLCSWTKADFIKADPRHGVDLYENFKAQLGVTADIIPPDEITDATGYDHQPFINPLVEEMEDGSSPIRSEIDPYLPQSTVEKVVQISGQAYTIDPKDIFDDIPQTHPFSLLPTSGVHTSIQHGCGGLVRQMALGSSRSSSPSLSSMPQYHPTASLAPVATETPTSTTGANTTPLTTKPTKRGRGRPRKNQPSMEDGSDGEYVPYKTPKSSGGQRGGPRGKRPHSNRMLHLWEFIRDLLLDPKYNPTLIRWENRREGVFRVICSKEVARMWGVRKQNPDMTYEKFSRSMRFCRTAEYFGEVPKDGKYPKKLCFAFGPRAHGWQPNSVINQYYYPKTV